MPLPDLGAAKPEELVELLRPAYAVALLLPPALTPRDRAHRRDTGGTEAALWMAGGIDPAYVVAWLRNEADRLEESMNAPVAPTASPVDRRDPMCVAAWPECYDGGYDPRCCRFPKSCSVDLIAPPLET